MDEIQSAYWNSAAVTLHPVVAYYKEADDSLQHKNYIYVSDVGNHNTAAVYTILKKLVPEIKSVIPGTEMIHYWTDSPSSQYRNRYVFDIILRHTEIFGIGGRWNYFESGHGKGPCDGLGGVSKRQAGEACKQGKVNIQGAADFFNWAQANQKNIEYRYYSAEEYQSSADELNSKQIKVVPGTMKLHAIQTVDGKLYTATTSCYCEQCVGGTPCGHWASLHNTNGLPPSTKNGEPRCDQQQDVFDKQKQIPKANAFVVANYDKGVYIGKVLEVDESEEDARITFMEKTRGKGAVMLFKWPANPDEIWVNFDKIIATVQEPIPYGKTKRQFKLNGTDSDYFNDI